MTFKPVKAKRGPKRKSGHRRGVKRWNPESGDELDRKLRRFLTTSWGPKEEEREGGKREGGAMVKKAK